MPYHHIRSKAAPLPWWSPRKWVMNVAIAVDQLGNALTAGSPDETISSRSGRAARKGKWWGRFMCWWLGKLDPGHCEQAIESEETGAHLPEELRKRGGL